MDEGSRRLQGMPPIPGLPHHLLGALGSRMHYMMQKSFPNSLSSSNRKSVLVWWMVYMCARSPVCVCTLACVCVCVVCVCDGMVLCVVLYEHM